MHKIVPAGETISDLRKKAADCEEKAKQAAEPEAAKLREEALLYREWIALLRLRERHPDWDDAALTEIAEEIVGVYRRLDEVCRERIRQRRPDLDEVGVQICMRCKATPGIPMIEPELLLRMHLAPEERVQQVAVLMADKVC